MVPGGLLVRADGDKLGRSVPRGEAVTTALAFAGWFVTSGGARGGRGRMAAHLAAGAILPAALRGEAEPAPIMAAARPGLYAQGAMVGVAFGQMAHATLNQFAGCGHALRMTPWRMVLSEAKRVMPNATGLITEAYDPALRVIACSGAPRCREAHADTRGLAAALAPNIGAGRTATRLRLCQGLRPFWSRRHHSGRDRRRLRSRARRVDAR
ncbi:hypothetical protein ACVWZ6_004355 [Bradyrhizobium sp. GM6.1]